MEMKKEQAKRYVIVGGVAGGATAARKGSRARTNPAGVSS